MDDEYLAPAGAAPQPAGGRRSISARAGDGGEFVDLDACDLMGAGSGAELGR
ncbi:hypothetical protein [Labedella populi]|uniref:hypothetical protein n=1 Tax=Labedella populi TaxID=2498850 RepID=UPI00140AB9A6|nr:hypothetical protein [Labedella populi]